jgi:hypothetical protein
MILTQTDPVSMIELKMPEKITLMIVALHADNANQTKMSMPYLSRKTGLHLKSLQRALKSLEELCLIETDRHSIGRGMSVSFQLNLQSIQTFVEAKKMDTESTFMGLKGGQLNGKMDTESAFNEKGGQNEAEKVDKNVPAITSVTLEQTNETILSDFAQLNINKPSPESSNGHHIHGELLVNFERWYASYPKKQAKAKAEQEWAKIRPDSALTEHMIRSVKAQSKTVQWQKEQGQYIPMPSTWLHQRRWEDDLVIWQNGRVSEMPKGFQ